jgi:hypothetical protein
MFRLARYVATILWLACALWPPGLHAQPQPQQRPEPSTNNFPLQQPSDVLRQQPQSSISNRYPANRVCLWMDSFGKGGSCPTRQPVGASCHCVVVDGSPKVRERRPREGRPPPDRRQGKVIVVN